MRGNNVRGVMYQASRHQMEVSLLMLYVSPPEAEDRGTPRILLRTPLTKLPESSYSLIHKIGNDNPADIVDSYCAGTGRFLCDMF